MAKKAVPLADIRYSPFNIPPGLPLLLIPAHIPAEPVPRQLCHLFERSRFLEQMRCSWHDLQRANAVKVVEDLPVQIEHGRIGASDDQEDRRAHEIERVGKIRASPAGDNRVDLGRPSRRSLERRGRAGAGAKEADREPPDVVFSRRPVDNRRQSLGQQPDVEAELSGIVSMCSSSSVSRSVSTVAMPRQLRTSAMD